MVRIFLADDHPVVRRGLRAVLEAESDLSVVGEAGDGLEAVAACERLQPDVLIVDLMMPGLNGLEVTRQVVQRCPRTGVIVLSMHDDEGYVRESLKNGAVGYLLKDDDSALLVEAIRAVTTGKRYLSPVLGERVLEAYVQLAGQSPEDTYSLLSTREREVLQLASEGLTSAAIADRLSISSRTVETHRANVMKKLGLSTQTDLVRYAIRRGLIEP